MTKKQQISHKKQLMSDHLAKGFALTVNHVASWRYKSEELFAAASRLIEKEHHLPLRSQAFSHVFSALYVRHCDDPEDFLRSHPRFDLSYVWMMLVGQGVECLLKAIALAQGKSLTNDGKVSYATNHDLCWIAQDIGFPLDDERKLMLSRLRASIQWVGRYPVPKDPDQNLLNWDYDENATSMPLEYQTSALTGSMAARIISLIGDLRAALEGLIGPYPEAHVSPLEDPPEPSSPPVKPLTPVMRSNP